MFDETKFEEKIQKEFEEFQGELQTTSDKKSEILLQVTHFQKSLMDLMELLLETEHARKIRLPTIIDIFNAKGILSDQDAEDARKINKIRNIIAHNFNKKSIEEAEKIIFTINLRLWEPALATRAHLPSVYDTLEKESQNWDMYRRLDFICFNLIMNMGNHITLLRES